MATLEARPALIRDARDLSTSRNQIAHGIVYSIPIVVKDKDGNPTVQTGYSMVPPWHGVFHLTKKTGQYFYSARDVDARTQTFQALAVRDSEFNRLLLPDAPKV
jgi:hypothetical protein